MALIRARPRIGHLSDLMHGRTADYKDKLGEVVAVHEGVMLVNPLDYDRELPFP